jgi:hypothetical protein
MKALRACASSKGKAGQGAPPDKVEIFETLFLAV